MREKKDNVTKHEHMCYINLLKLQKPKKDFHHGGVAGVIFC